MSESKRSSGAGLCVALLAAAGLAGCAAFSQGFSTPPTAATPATAPMPAPAPAVTTAAAPAAPPAAPAAVAPPAARPAPALAAAPPAPAAPAAPPPPPFLPFDEAVNSAANNLLGKAQLPPVPPAPRFQLVIDPLIDGMTGAQVQATQQMGARLVALIRERYPQYEVIPFTPANVAKSPLVLVGTFTGVNKDRKTEGIREGYRICLALADLKTGKLVSKGLAFAQPQGVDITPSAHFRDGPAVSDDPATLGYIRTCQGTRAGDPIHPLYVDRIVAGAMLSEAMEAYAAGRFAEALALYESASKLPEGNQIRTHTGLYLTNWKLGRRTAAVASFGDIVDQGLDSKRLGVKFVFRPGSTVLAPDAPGAAPQQLWLTELATRAARRSACLEITGHSSPTGPEPINERLSVLRAEYVKQQLERREPPLAQRTIANGVGSRQTLVGSGKDDASDALDRRVEFKVINCT